MAKRLMNHPKVVRHLYFRIGIGTNGRGKKTILWNTVATECKGDGDLLNSVRIKNVKTGAEEDLPVNGLFYAIGTSRLPFLFPPPV